MRGFYGGGGWISCVVLCNKNVTSLTIENRMDLQEISEREASRVPHHEPAASLASDSHSNALRLDGELHANTGRTLDGPKGVVATTDG